MIMEWRLCGYFSQNSDLTPNADVLSFYGFASWEIAMQGHIAVFGLGNRFLMQAVSVFNHTVRWRGWPYNPLIRLPSLKLNRTMMAWICESIAWIIGSPLVSMAEWRFLPRSM